MEHRHHDRRRERKRDPGRADPPLRALHPRGALRKPCVQQGDTRDQSSTCDGGDSRSQHALPIHLHDPHHTTMSERKGHEHHARHQQRHREEHERPSSPRPQAGHGVVIGHARLRDHDGDGKRRSDRPRRGHQHRPWARTGRFERTQFEAHGTHQRQIEGRGVSHRQSAHSKDREQHAMSILAPRQANAIDPAESIDDRGLARDGSLPKTEHERTRDRPERAHERQGQRKHAPCADRITLDDPRAQRPLGRTELPPRVPRCVRRNQDGHDPGDPRAPAARRAEA